MSRSFDVYRLLQGRLKPSCIFITALHIKIFFMISIEMKLLWEGMV